MNYNLLSQFPGEAGIYQTLSVMRNMVNRAMLDPKIRERAAVVTQGCARDRDCEHYSLMSWVHGNVQFIRDPNGVEALHDPVTFYEKRIRVGEPVFGDCDDMSMYLAALLKSIGHAPKFRVIGRTNQFTHVHILCEGAILDPTFEFGRGPSEVKRAIQVDI